MRKIRLALLLADTPAPTIVEKYGDYMVLFSNLLKSAVDRSKRLRESAVDLDIKGFDVVHKMELPDDINQFDAVMITGSAASAYEDKPWINKLVGFTTDVITKHPVVRVVGVCFGHQIVARAMGGKVIKNPLGWEVGVTEFSLTNEGRRFFESGRDTLRIQEMHQDHVATPPSGFVNLGSTITSPIQGMLKSDHVLTVQGHPEFTSGVVKEIVRLRSGKVFSPEFARKSTEAAGLEHDGVWIGSKFIEFILDGRTHPDDEACT